VTATADGTGDRMPAGGAGEPSLFVPAAKNLVRLNQAAGDDVEEQALTALHTEHLRRRIREVLAALPDGQRRAIRLRLFEARGDAEIAPLLGVTPQRVSPAVE
jgi:DNA-directed RNA polymerase specialized sigma24 family protein